MLDADEEAEVKDSKAEEADAAELIQRPAPKKRPAPHRGCLIGARVQPDPKHRLTPCPPARPPPPKLLGPRSPPGPPPYWLAEARAITDEEKDAAAEEVEETAVKGKGKRKNKGKSKSVGNGKYKNKGAGKGKHKKW